MIPSGQEVLFTRQRHEAKRAGLHYDLRIVVGEKAYSWATRKDIPEPGKSILLFEQPVHTSHYALSEKVEIPEGQYGAGVTTLDFVRKAKIGEGSSDEKMTLHVNGKEKYLLKKLPEKYGKKAWLFRNLSEQKENMSNKYLEKISVITLSQALDNKSEDTRNTHLRSIPSKHAGKVYSRISNVVKNSGETPLFKFDKSEIRNHKNSYNLSFDLGGKDIRDRSSPVISHFNIKNSDIKNSENLKYRVRKSVLDNLNSANRISNLSPHVMDENLINSSVDKAVSHARKKLYVGRALKTSLMIPLGALAARHLLKNLTEQKEVTSKISDHMFNSGEYRKHIFN